jgi:Zinc knuckle
MAADCTSPRDMSDVQCKRCETTGHFAKDCPDKPPPAPCHNCGEMGHRKTECTNERVMKCRNCDECRFTSNFTVFVECLLTSI